MTFIMIIFLLDIKCDSLLVTQRLQQQCLKIWLAKLFYIHDLLTKNDIENIDDICESFLRLFTDHDREFSLEIFQWNLICISHMFYLINLWDKA
jgi:hypothetical protein